MATITVTTNSDTIDAGDNVTSLREAIAQAEAAAGADTIVFDAGLAGETIILSHAAGMKALTISSDITIDGDINGDEKADITIDGDRSNGAGMPQADFHSVFEITGGTVTLDSLTITGGRALTGGGIDIASGATVTIDHSTVTGNYVSGFESNSAVAGAGIANAGTLTVTNSAIHENYGGAGTSGDATGGGIYNTGTLTVFNTTIANNQMDGGESDPVTGTGKARGAGIASIGGTATLDNVTVTGNSARYFGSGETETFPGAPTGTGTPTSFGGLYGSGGTFTVLNSIVLGNVREPLAPGSGLASDVSSTGITWDARNIVGTGADTDASDHVIQALKAGLVFDTVVDANTVSAVAGKLADNGGPVKTVKLNDDRYNPAIDGTGGLATPTDARGEAAHDDGNIANPGGSARDLGAYEVGTDTPANTAPVITGSLAGTVTEGGFKLLRTADLYYTDPDVLDDDLNVNFTVSGQTGGVVRVNGINVTTFGARELRTGQVTFNHNGAESSSAGFYVIVEDGNEDASDPTRSFFNFDVTGVNDTPKLNKLIADVKLPIHTDYTIAVANNFKDPEGSKLTFTAKQSNGAALPAWLMLSTDGAFSLKPPDSVSGTFTIKVTAKDSGGKAVSDTFNIVVPKKPGLTAGADNLSDSLTGTSAGNVINAGNGANTVNSAGGNDVVYTGTGTDKVDLGSGDDKASLGDGNDSGKGGLGADTINGEGGNDSIYGGDGNDTLNGNAGNDKIWGDANDDKIDGGNGDDTIHGGTGNDRLSGDTDNKDLGSDTIYGDAGDDVIEGGNGVDVLRGGTGNDTIWAENPSLYSGGANGNMLYGDAGNDKLYGGYSSDTLSGGDGNDTLFGSLGADKFKFALSALAGIDTIVDFEPGVDKIQLPALFAGSTLAAYGAVQSATDKLIYDAATGALYFDNDANGTGVAVKFAVLQNKAAITIGDFLFV